MKWTISTETDGNDGSVAMSNDDQKSCTDTDPICREELAQFCDQDAMIAVCPATCGKCGKTKKYRSMRVILINFRLIG